MPGQDFGSLVSVNHDKICAPSDVLQLLLAGDHVHHLHLGAGQVDVRGRQGEMGDLRRVHDVLDRQVAELGWGKLG